MKESSATRAGSAGLILVALVCACVAALDLRLALAHPAEIPTRIAKEDNYNRLVRGFESGHLYITAPIPAEMAGLPDPYDPEQNREYRGMPPFVLGDTSYFKGHAYLYFGVTPALIAFWPWHLLTGAFLAQNAVVAAFALTGFLASVAILLSVRRRYCPDVPALLLAGAALVLGTATTVPMLLARSDLWEIPVSCGYALSMLALGSAWLSWHHPGRRGRLAWLAAAGLMAGLAVGARPTLVFGMTGLLAAAALCAPGMRPGGNTGGGRPARLLAAALPFALIGAGLAFYNQARFGSPFEFGQHYQLSGDDVHGRTVFSAAFLPENLRLYLFSTLEWSARYPFAWASYHHVFTPGHSDTEFITGLVPSLPILLFAAAAPLSWKARGPSDRPALRSLATILALMGAFGLAVPLAFYGATNRYEVDYLPAVALLACLGLFACDSRLRADRPPAWRRIGRPLTGALLLYSCAVPTLAALSRSTYSQEMQVGTFMYAKHRVDGETKAFGMALETSHGESGGYELGEALFLGGHYPEAFSVLDRARRAAPDDPDVLFNLGRTCFRLGKTEQAGLYLREAIRVRPTKVDALEELGCELVTLGKSPEATAPLKEALRLAPANSFYCYNLGLDYMYTDHPVEAIPLLEYAAAREPELPQIRQYLAKALFETNRIDEAMRILAGPQLR